MVRRVILPLPPACGPLSSARCHALTCTSLCLVPQTEDYLKRKIRSRPERSELVRMHILEGEFLPALPARAKSPEWEESQMSGEKQETLLKEDPYSKQ